MNELAKALEDLGETLEEVYTKLKEAGIKGRQTVCSMCPIANYLSELGFRSPKVGIGAGIDAGSPTTDEIYLGVPHTEATKQFVRAFDDGHFPDLEE
jgi:hypothetical protein